MKAAFTSLTMPTMKPFERCPICGGELVAKQVEKLLRGGVHTAVMVVPAEVCQRCGERLYPEKTARRFEEVRAKLERGEVSGFQLLGQFFRTA